ncbi:MAG: nucleotide exchange factor GrpE [Methanoregulaceae archaeon]|nr:nucleotide exchange factor GrpE [Methanoregulaceae archaeon]
MDRRMVDLEGEAGKKGISEKERTRADIQDASAHSGVCGCTCPDHEDRFLRLAADFDNYRKQADRERESLALMTEARLLKEFLPILDDIGRALDSAGNGLQKEGLLMIQKSLSALFARHGIRRIECTGRKFDPAFHEVLCSVPSTEPEGTILGVYETGYIRGSLLLRPARVRIAGSKTTETR